MAATFTVSRLFHGLRGRPMTLDGPMLTAIGVLFTTATGAIGWLVAKLWAERSDMQAKFVDMLGKQFDDAARRTQLFNDLAQATKDLTREVQGARSDIQRIRP